MNVVEQCAGKLESSIKQFIISSMSGDRRSSKYEIDYYEVIYDIYRCAPQVLSGVVPYLTGELLNSAFKVLTSTDRSVGHPFKSSEIGRGPFTLPGCNIPEIFQHVFLEFLKRLSDRVVEVRMSVLDHIKSCLFSNPCRSEAPQIIAALCDQLLDYDENVRKQVVAVICDVACHALTSIPVETIKLLSERLQDKSVHLSSFIVGYFELLYTFSRYLPVLVSLIDGNLFPKYTQLLVKKFTMEWLAEIYRNYCLNCLDGSIDSDEYDWIPGKILRCLYDKDFRSDTVEPVPCLSLFPAEFSVRDKVKNWITARDAEVPFSQADASRW